MPRILPYERHLGTLIVCPTGDSLSVQELDLKREIDALHDLLDDPRVTGLLVDLGKAPYFSSIVLGSVLAMCQKIRSRAGGHGRAAFCNASPGMLDIMQIMKLDAVLPYYPIREDALAALAAR